MKTRYSFLLILTMTGLSLFSCKEEKKQNMDEMTTQENTFDKDQYLNSTAFDTVVNDKKVGLYWIGGDSIKVAFTNYGGRIIGLWVPNKDGNMTDVVVGFGNLKGYINSSEVYYGATIGRVGNRIAKGKFTIDGKAYSVPLNNGENALHGGPEGFQNKVFEVAESDDDKIVFTYNSPDGEMGFPGNLNVKVTYSIDGTESLKMEYEATTDKKTPVNLTNHAYFNLNGEGSGDILNHRLKIYADQFTPVDKGLIPTGELKDVQGTPFDFTDFHTIGERIGETNEQLEFGLGYDHNYVLNGTKAEGMNHAATFIGDKSGIEMNVYTEEPGVQFYSGNFMAGENTFKTGATDDHRTAFAIETQHYPDAPNQKDFPSIILNPGDTYHTVSLYTFSKESKSE